MTAATQEAQAESPTIEIDDLEQFVRIMAGWHGQKVKALKHMLEIPEGVEMLVSGETPVVLAGDLLAGFKAGIELSLMELGTLPFAYETEPEAATTDV